MQFPHFVPGQGGDAGAPVEPQVPGGEGGRQAGRVPGVPLPGLQLEGGHRAGRGGARCPTSPAAAAIIDSTEALSPQFQPV